MTEEEKTIIRQILTTQDSGQRLYFQMQAQLNALTTALIGLDPRVATLYSEEFEIEQKKLAALLEKHLKELALLRAKGESEPCRRLSRSRPIIDQGRYPAKLAGISRLEHSLVAEYVKRVEGTP
jgi:hypothetical protein